MLPGRRRERRVVGAVRAQVLDRLTDLRVLLPDRPAPERHRPTHRVHLPQGGDKAPNSTAVAAGSAGGESYAVLPSSQPYTPTAARTRTPAHPLRAAPARRVARAVPGAATSAAPSRSAVPRPAVGAGVRPCPRPAGTSRCRFRPRRPGSRAAPPSPGTVRRPAGAPAPRRCRARRRASWRWRTWGSGFVRRRAPERSQRGPAIATAYLRRLRASAHPTLTALHAAPTAAYSELPTP